MSIQKVRQAIEIQGHITVYVTERGRTVAHKARKVTVGQGGEWVTDIMTSDLCGYVRIKKTKKAVIAQAERIIANEATIRAERAAHDREVADRMQWS